MSGEQLRWGMSTDVGRVRRVNQDAGMANGRLFAVADGMGGHRGGEVASDIAAGHLIQIEDVSSADELSDAVERANTLIRGRAATDPDLAGMGTTVVALAVVSPDGDLPIEFAAANVGDSRLYRLENGEFEQLTKDHSLVAELARAGQITEEEAATHPQRNVVTRALGADDDVLVDTWLFPARAGQRFLLCSDGLINEVSDTDVAHVLREVADPKLATMHLVDMANRAGGRDNVTVLVVDVIGDQAEEADEACETPETES